MNTTTLDVFHQVARREISSRDGAEQLAAIEAIEADRSRPPWLPEWLYVLGAAVLMVVLNPLATRDRG